MKLIFARCSVEYTGRLNAFLPVADRLIMVKADGSVLIHSEAGSYKPLNWMMAPTRITITKVHDPDLTPDQPRPPVADLLPLFSTADDPAASGTDPDLAPELQPQQIWKVEHTKSTDQLQIKLFEIYDEMDKNLGIDPGLQKDGVEMHLQKLLAEQVAQILGPGWELVRREYPTPIGPVDHLVKDPDGKYVIIEVKRRGEIDGVEQLTRYLDLLSREPQFSDLRGIFAAQEIRPQARTLAQDRGIKCLLLDYEQMRGVDDRESRLF